MSRAIVIHAARDLRVEERPAEAPGPGEVAIEMARGGICGSDLHYFQHGGFGTVRLREPMILGHEVVGTISRLGEGVDGLAVGARVAVSPSRPCNKCRYCLEGKQQHCLDMRFYGSAMPMPHIQGAFRQQIVALASQCHFLSEGVAFEQAVFAEPFSVALHAVQRAGTLFGRRVIITGAGPIGALCVIAARLAGAASITVTDIQDATLQRAVMVGADETVNVAKHPQAYGKWAVEKGTFDVAIEASGNENALRALLDVVRPQGTIVQLGLGGEFAVPINAIVAREIELKGAFRFHAEFAQSTMLINQGDVDFSPLHTATFALDDAEDAFHAAGDRANHMKVQIDLS